MHTAGFYYMGQNFASFSIIRVEAVEAIVHLKGISGVYGRFPLIYFSLEPPNAHNEKVY